MQDKEIKYCKNKDCNKPLPDGYKHKYCEACRNKRVERFKNIGKGVGSVLGVAVLIISGGKIKK